MFKNTVQRLVVAVLIMGMIVPPGGSARELTGEVGALPSSSGLYRTRVAVRQPADWARLERLGVTVLEQGEDWALVLADEDQLETLARLRFEPQSTDELGMLVTAHAQAKPWLAASLRPLLQAWKEHGLPELTDQPLGRGSESANSAHPALPPELKAGLATLSSVDDDADGLTNTQEQWWCTDPLNPDSDGDGTNDGDEVQAAKDWLGNLRGSYPSTGKPFVGWPPDHTGCYDDDQDSIPDLAERWELGLNMNRESTDRDKFDDGQELFGNTYCPGSGGYCGYGALPRNEDWGIIFAEMPSWVKAPGNHPLVAAFPVPEIDVVESSLHVETVTEIKNEHTVAEGTERSYSTAKMEGVSDSRADTATWNEWEEVSESTPILAVGHVLSPRFALASDGFLEKLGLDETALDVLAFAGSTIALGAAPTPLTAVLWMYEGKKVLSKLWGQTFGDTGEDRNSCGPSMQRLTSVYTLASVQSCQSLASGAHVPSPEQAIKAQTIGPYSAERFASAGGTVREMDEQSNLTSRPTYPLVFPGPSFVPYTTETRGKSWGGARTTTHTEYEEHTVTNGEAFLDQESWSHATAINTAHAADLWFTYKVRNTGTEYAREIADLAFNIYIGDDLNPSYTYFVGPDLGGDGKFHNFMPGDEHIYTSRRISLTLNQMAAIDLGGPVRIVVEDFTYGIDELFYEDAVNAGVLVAIEDGTDDGDELIDTYLIPTWGEETVLDVLARYFPHTTDADGNLIAVWTPEQRADTPSWCSEPNRVGTTLWCKHALSTADWWNIYTDDLGDGSEGFQDTPAASGSVALFRFNKDSDLDGYSDRSEIRLGTDPNDPTDYPKPELIAGVHSSRSGDQVVATLSLLNTGLYDAYGVEAVMIAPDDSVSITNNTVGGSGRVRALKQVIVGSCILLQSPLPDPWTQDDHAVPAVGGYYTGAEDRTYTFTASCGDPLGCDVGSDTWSLAWDDGAGANGTLNFGNGYASPNFLNVGSLGVKLALYSGEVYNGNTFTVEARTPRDTFQYTINHEPYTEPVVIVSYNDPQGNHRFVTPLHLSTPTENLAPHSGKMLHGNADVEIVTQSPFDPEQANTTTLIAQAPVATCLVDAHLHLEFIDPEGTVVREEATTVTLETGPNVVDITWNPADFNPAYDPEQDYIVMAFFTDWQGNILDTAARPLSSFQEDPKPVFALDETGTTWDFGTVPQGTLLEHTFTLANTGMMNLKATVVGTGIRTDQNVPGNPAWTDTGLDVAVGDAIGIRASGTVCYGGNGTTLCYGPDGSGEAAPGGWTLPGASKFSLIAKIGDGGAPFFVGSTYVSTAISSGRLYLGTNDCGGCYGDNGGTYQAHIEIQGVPTSFQESPSFSVSPADATNLDVTLDTYYLPTGLFNRTVLVRTSDPAYPTQTFQVQGTIDPYVAPARSMAVSPYRPWDQRVAVSGDREYREVVTFNDTITADAADVQPLRVYNDTRQTALGVGREVAQAAASGGLAASSADEIALTSGEQVYSSPAAAVKELELEPSEDVSLLSSLPWWNGNYLYRRQIFLTGSLPAGTTIKLNALNFNQLQSEGKVKSDKADVRIVRYASGTWQEVARRYITEWEVDFKLLSNLSGSDDSYWLYYGNPNASSPPTFSPPAQGWWVDMYHDKWWTEYGGTWTFNQSMDFDNVCGSPLDHDGRIGSSFDESDKFRGRLFIPTTGTWTFRVYTHDGYRLYLDGGEIGHFDGYNDNRWYTIGSAYLKAGWYKMDLRNMWVNCGAWKFNMEGPGFGNQRVPAHYFARLWEDLPSSVTIGSEIPKTGTISGRVFEDLNSNGTQDAGEPGLAGVTVSLSGGQTQMTGRDDSYALQNTNNQSSVFGDGRDGNLVIGPPGGHSGSATLYEHPSYGGRSETFTQDDPRLSSNTIGNDSVSSVRINGDFGITLYEHDNYFGAYEGFTSSDSDLGNNTIGHDRTSSVRRGVDTVVNIAANLSGNASSGQRVINTDNGGIFQTGDSVLILQAFYPSSNVVGTYEVAEIESISGNQLTLKSPLANSYWHSGWAYAPNASNTFVVKIPQYNNVTINKDGRLTSFSGGYTPAGQGILAFKVQGTLTINSGGLIDVWNQGYEGGWGGSYGDPGNQGQQGESYAGYGNYARANNGGGGGGGGDGSGGGAGHATSGEDGQHNGGYGGGTYGVADLSRLTFGSGGGRGIAGAGSHYGGMGGGIVLIWANTIVVNNGGMIRADGQNGDDGSGRGGGGGSGGSIKLIACNVTLGNSRVTAVGGLGGYRSVENRGGNGGVGRIRIEYCDTFSGSTNPSASAAKINFCYGTVSGKAFSDDNGDGDQDAGESGLADVNVSLSDGQTTTTGSDGSYSFTANAPADYTVSVTPPTGYDCITPCSVNIALEVDSTTTVNFALRPRASISGKVFHDTNNNGVQDAGESGVGGVTVTLDGTGQTRTTASDGSYSFDDLTPGNYSVSVTVPDGYVNTTPTTVSCNLGAGDTCTANFGILMYDIEKVSGSGHQNRLFLPEDFRGGRRYWVQYGRAMTFSGSGEATAQVKLPKVHYGEATMDVLLTEAGNSFVQINLDVGNDGTWDWGYNGSPAIPTILKTSDFAEDLNDFMDGATPDPDGLVTVPLRVSLNTSGQLYLTNLVATPDGISDVSIAPEDIELSPTDPVEGDTVNVQAALHNDSGYDTGGLTVSFFATPPDGFGETYIGSGFVSNIPAAASTLLRTSGTAQASIQWNTLGFTGDVPVRVVADPYDRVAETDDDNNEATASLTILTRPDLHVTAIEPSDPEPVAGQPVTVTLTISNAGQTDAGTSALALYDGNPDDGGTLLGEGNPAVPGESEATLDFTWTPTAPGPHRLFAISDRDDAVNEFDEWNNQSWQDVYVGFAGPLLLDSGNLSADPVYTTTLGYGYVDEGQADFLGNCGSEPHQTYRRDPSNRVVYRFDHLLPGHFYHLDVTLFNCPAQPRRLETVLVDGIAVAGPIDLKDDGEIHYSSTLLDPALYANRTISVTIQSSGSGAVVSEVNLHDIDYRYVNAGGDNDLRYTPERGYGYLDEASTHQTIYGTLPYQSYREDQGDAELRYQFDGLDPAKRYLVHLTFYQASPFTITQQVAIDSVDTGLTVEVGPDQILTPTIPVPLGTYQDDGRVVVRITRPEAGAFVNEISLEELTQGTLEETQTINLHTGWNWFSFALEPKIERDTTCTGVTPTSAFSSFTGDVLIDEQPAPVGTLVEGYSPRGDKVGCVALTTAGVYPFVRVYGEEGPLPGMRAGEPVIFKVNGVPATITSGSSIWQNDRDTHIVDLAASSLAPIEKVLAPIGGAYEKLLCEDGTYRPLPANPVFNSCHTMQPGRGYLIYMTEPAALIIQGTRVPADTPLELKEDWNWIGYLPQCSLAIETALASIDGKFDLLHGEDGTYQPPPDNPRNTLHQMGPGCGYMIRMTEAATLTYPASACGAALPQASEVSETSEVSTLRQPFDVAQDKAQGMACDAIPTPYFTTFYGTVMLGNRPYPAGAWIEALSPRDEVVGCSQIVEEGVYQFLRVYGADEDMDIPGMQAGEPVAFRVNGQMVELDNPPYWQNDRDVHELDLRVEPNWLYLPLVRR